MYSRRLTITLASAALFLTIGGSAAFQTVRSAGHGDEPVVVATGEGGEKKGGNRLVRALKAPFKAIGRIFGGGKSDENKISRLREKDVKRFESAPLLRVTDAHTPAPVPAEPGDSTAELVSEGRAALARGSVNEAIELLSRAVSLGPQRWEPYHLLGVAYFRKGFPDQSRLAFERSLRYGGKNAETLSDFGYALHRFGDNEGAVKYLKRAAQLAPANPRIWNNLALAQSRLSKYDDALKSFTRARGELYGRMNVAALLIRSGRHTEAVKHYEAARRLDPNSRVVLQQLAELYRSLGRAQDAEVAVQALDAVEKSQPAKGQ